MKIKETVEKQIFEYKRIIAISRKPTREEYLTIVKVSALGIGLMGLLGFVIQILGQIL
ncbi:MAG: protein translocase SEC61 complex subunit gamma [Nanoarchaeota archaeon]|nr:protein translocase SEC61 complex subunit gamma [Nanoarchaeota archaeon]